MRRISASLWLLLPLICIACGTVEVPPVDVATREVRDDLGRTVVVPEKIDRVVSLAPSLTEMIFAVGAGDRLVGVTTYCNYPPEATRIEKIGDTQTPNIEKIIALRPQVVFVSTASQLEAFTRTLDDQKIAVYVTDARTLDQVFDNLIHFGELLGTEKRARHVALDLEGRVSIVWNRLDHTRYLKAQPERPVPRVFVQISNDPLFTVGRESFITELIEKAGARSVTDDIAPAYFPLSKETAAALDPDVIFLSDSEDNRVPSSVFANSEAVKNGRVYRINADIISRPGPRLVDALEQIAAKLNGMK